MHLEITVLLIVVIAIALFLALTNGMHDVSSIVAIFIASGAATPLQAVGLAAVFGLAGAVLSGSAVADTIVKIVGLSAEPALLNVLAAALLGAVLWNLMMWRFGLPSSSTHALIGGVIGAVWISSGFGQIMWGWRELFGSRPELTGIMKIVAALIISPPLGFALAFLLQKTAMLALRNAKFTVNRLIKKLQWIMAALLACSYGANDAQKIIGFITMALMAAGYLHRQATPEWVRIAAGLVMFAGTMFGGWPIMKTLGRSIFKLRPIHSLNSQLASGGAIMLATLLGVPVSTTHIVSSSVIGVGTAEEYRMVNWNVGREMIVAWFITIPCTALVAALAYNPILWLFKLLKWF